MEYEKAIECISSRGPTFGNGNDISVYDNSNSNSNSYVCGGSSCAYNVPKAANEYSILTDGKPTFQTTEIEVYLVQWTDAKEVLKFSKKRGLIQDYIERFVDEIVQR